MFVDFLFNKIFYIWITLKRWLRKKAEGKLVIFFSYCFILIGNYFLFKIMWSNIIKILLKIHWTEKSKHLDRTCFKVQPRNHSSIQPHNNGANGSETDASQTGSFGWNASGEQYFTSTSWNYGLFEQMKRENRSLILRSKGYRWWDIWKLLQHKQRDKFC